MTVKVILANKGQNVVSIAPTATLEEATETLVRHNIGALVVLGPEQRLIGMLSERDIVRALATEGAAVLKKPLSQVMTRKVGTCTEADAVSVIMEQMTHGKFRH